MEPEGVTMASSISAAIREPGVTVSNLRTMSRPCLLLVVVMHPYRWSLKVTMASSISAAVRVVWSLELLQIISLYGWSRTDGSAAVREP